MSDPAMSSLLVDLLDKSKANKKGLSMLKNTAVRCQQFELASELRQLETSLFPETEEEKQAKAYAQEVNLLLRMVGLEVSEPNCWLISQALKRFTKTKGRFAINDAADLMRKQKDIFDL